jgi:hypothetical protein
MKVGTEAGAIPANVSDNMRPMLIAGLAKLAGGAEGPAIPMGMTVETACKVSGFTVADGDTWWYRIASSPWNGRYYASADAFYNNGQTSGRLQATPFVDPDVRSCSSF